MMHYTPSGSRYIRRLLPVKALLLCLAAAAVLLSPLTAGLHAQSIEKALKRMPGELLPLHNTGLESDNSVRPFAPLSKHIAGASVGDVISYRLGILPGGVRCLITTWQDAPYCYSRLQLLSAQYKPLTDQEHPIGLPQLTHFLTPEAQAALSPQERALLEQLSPMVPLYWWLQEGKKGAVLAVKLSPSGFISEENVALLRSKGLLDRTLFFTVKNKKLTPAP